LAPLMGLCRTSEATRAIARSSAWFHPSPLLALPAPVAASVITPAIQGNCCRWRGGSVRKAGERSTKGECGSTRQVHGVLEGVPSTRCRVRTPSKLSFFPIYDLAEMSANRLVFQEMCSSKRSPKRRFGQETRQKCRALGKILIHVQTLDL
jgi:hypothetical protein